MELSDNAREGDFGGVPRNSTEIGTLMFAPNHKLFISCPSKFSLPALVPRLLSSPPTPFTYVVSLWVVSNRRRSPQHLQSLARSLMINLFSPNVCLLNITDPEQSPWNLLLSTCSAK